MAKTVLVTGAGGFLGSHLAEFFLEKDWQVVGVDNFSTGQRSNKSYLEQSPRAANLKFFEADIVEPWHFLDQAQLEGLDLVLHFASPASPPHYQRLSLETIHANTVGLERALKVAQGFGARVIFASTSEVYGDPEVHPQNENYWGSVNSFGERACYDESKRLGEALIFTYNKRYGTRHGLVRIFNTYGPRMNREDGRVVVNLLIQAMKGAELTLYGDGTQTRSFCYVDDLIEGIFSYAISSHCLPVNLGNSSEFSLLELVEVLRTKIFPEKRLQVIHLPLPKDDPKQRCPDLTRAIELLHPWRPRVYLEEGLKRMLLSFNKEKP